MMYFKTTTICWVFILSHFLVQYSEGQGTNLLQRYIQQYFKDYYPSTVRQYTLYGNGQNGAADFGAGLPYPYEKQGKVNSLIFSTSNTPPLSPPKVSKRRTAGAVENAWVYPGPTNNLNPSTENNFYNNQLQQQPQPIYQQQPQSLPVAESRMVEEDQRYPSMDMSNYNFNRDNGDEFAEIPVQSAMAF